MAFNYRLISCNPSNYPDIDCLGWNTLHPMAGKFVFVNEFFQGNPVNVNRVYELDFLGDNVCVFTDYVPDLVVSSANACTPIFAEYEYENCETGKREVFGFPTATPTNNVLRIDGSCDCWFQIGPSAPATRLLTSYTEYAGCKECLINRNDEICPTGERTLSYAVKVTPPLPIPPDRGFKKCGYISKVFGDLTDSSPYKNDFTGVYFKRPTNNSSVVFKLVDTANATEYLLNDNTYGTFQDFGGAQPDLSFYILEWKNVLALLGEGSYQIKQEVNFVGIPQDYYTNTFTLQAFSIDKANHTVRIDCTQDGFFVDKEVDFKGSGYKTSLRVNGFFGRAERSYEQNNLSTRDYKNRQISISINKEYKFQGLNLPVCVADELMDFVLKGNELFVSDYNKNNHSYNFELLPVELQDNEGSEYQTLTRGVKVNLLFTDRFKNNRKTNC